MGQINLHVSFNFLSLAPLSRLYHFTWSPQQKICYFDPAMDRGIKIVRQLK